MFTPFCKFMGQNSKYPLLQKFGNFLTSCQLAFNGSTNGSAVTYVRAVGCGPVIPVTTFVLTGDIHWSVYSSGRYSDSVWDGYRILFILGAGMH